MLDWLRRNIGSRQAATLAFAIVVAMFNAFSAANIDTLIREKGWDKILLNNWGPLMDASRFLPKS